MGPQGNAQTQEEVDENPTYAYLKLQPVSLNGKEYTEARKCRLCTGYVSPGSGTEIVYPGVPKPSKPNPIQETNAKEYQAYDCSTQNRQYEVVERGIVKFMEFAMHDPGAA